MQMDLKTWVQLGGRCMQPQNVGLLAKGLHTKNTEILPAWCSWQCRKLKILWYSAPILVWVVSVRQEITCFSAFEF